MATGTVLVITAIFAIVSIKPDVLTAQAPDTVAEPAAPLAISQVLHYQGRLLTPGTGEPKPNGDYQMTFSLYNVASGGSPLWTETKSVAVNNGSFATLLGTTTTLALNVFNGQELFLGITIAGDPEMTPRQRIAHSAYAMFAENAGLLDGHNSTAFAPASHNHSGAAINSGTVADARLPATIARDNEIVPAVLAADGANSTLDADLLDGQNSTAFAAATHNHDGAAINAGTITDARLPAGIARDSEIFPAVIAADGSGSGLDADTLDGLDSSAFFPRHRNTQFNSTLAVGGVHSPLSTHSWPLDWDMVWTIVPTTSGGRIAWSLDEVYLDPGTGGYTYIFTVRNTGSVATDYSLRYSVLR
jgi:hypothetical protein